MMELLTARFLRALPSAEGKLAEIELVEPNGDWYEVVCLVHTDGTEITGDAAVLDYLNERYGPVQVSQTARAVVESALEPGA